MAHCSSYDVGECTRGVCEALSWCPDGLGNAYQWADRAAARGYSLTTVPTVGAIVQYLPGRSYSDFGHVGVVQVVHSPTSFMVYEMNYARFDAYDWRESQTYAVRAFILPPGVPAGTGTTPPWLPLPNTVAALELSWGQMQQLWHSEVDTVVNASTGIVEILRAMELA